MQIIQKAEQFKERIAVIAENKTYTYEQLLNASALVATHLLNGKDDLSEERVTFMLAPGFDYVVAQWGIWRAGGIAVPLCILHPLDALQYVVEDVDSQVLIVDESYRELLSPLIKKRNMRLIIVEKIKPFLQKKLPHIAPSRRAMILYTSGTTSKPKGVVTTHANIESQIETLTTAWAWQADDHILNVLPLHHVHGIINAMSCAFWVGACCEFLPKFDVEKVWQKFCSNTLTLFMAVPTIYFKLIAHWEAVAETERTQMSASFKDMRLMVSGSAALPVSVLEKWQSITGHTLLERYGMTEIGMALSNSYEGERRAGHVGLPLPGVEMRLVDNDNREVEAGTQGEIQIKGKSVFLEYWNKPEATQAAFTEDAWFKTGDIAVWNDGSYKILGRDSVDIIKSGGYKISALEIEEVLRQHSDVKECAVVGIPDQEWGEIVGASLIVNNESVDFDELKMWLKTKLPQYKVPRRFIIQNELPRNTLGKVTKKPLLNLFLKL